MNDVPKIDLDSKHQLFQKILQIGLKRPSLERVRKCFLELRPELVDHPDRTKFLKDSLDLLEVDKLIRFPVTKRSWDHNYCPSLPLWISVQLPLPSNSVNPMSISWVPEMSFAAQLTNSSQIRDAILINQFLIHFSSSLEIPIPLRERSLEIFGDEKRMDDLLKRGLFGGKLQLDVLGTFPVAPPIAHETVKSAVSRRILVVENHHTFWSMCKWNTLSRAYRAVAFGSGNYILNNTAGLVELIIKENADSFDYFGDVDGRGLEILISLVDLMRTRHGITGFAAKQFYEWILEKGHRRQTNDTCSLTEWCWTRIDILDEAIGSGLLAEIGSGYRIPQESLNFACLNADFLMHSE